MFEMIDFPTPLVTIMYILLKSFKIIQSPMDAVILKKKKIYLKWFLSFFLFFEELKIADCWENKNKERPRMPAG